jgi:hypothetical protein
MNKWDEWMNEWMYVCMYECMNIWMYEWIMNKFDQHRINKVPITSDSLEHISPIDLKWCASDDSDQWSL